MFRLGHSPLSINMESVRQCSCGSTETLEHLLQCNLSLRHRSIRLTLKNTFLNEQNYYQPQCSALTSKTLIHILLFDLPELPFKPTVAIFTAFSRFLKHCGRFQILVC